MDVLDEKVTLILPWYIRHTIDETSPLHHKNMSISDLKDAEILVTINGVDSATSSNLAVCRHVSY